mgnify:CR=1 FL=1
MDPKFYTLPPIPWPYVLVNANNPNLAYIRKNWRQIDSVIIDSGVEIFKDPRVKDYPEGWIGRLVELYNAIRPWVKEVWVTVPDYPDDYHPKSLWLDGKTNIERTIDNVIKALDAYPKVNWLIPIQGHNRDPISLLKSIKYLRELGITETREYFAVANLCVESKTELIVKSVGLVRQELPNKKLHVFGIKLNALKKISHLIDSFDSFAWTRPVKKPGHSAKTLEERRKYFYEWLDRLKEVIPKVDGLL